MATAQTPPPAKSASTPVLARSWHAGAVVAALFCAATVAAAATYESRPLRLGHLTADDGLSQSTVLCIFQDSVGYMWFGTEDGLNRYDGHGFVIYRHDPADPESLPGDFVWAVAEDAAGDLWIGTDGGGVAHWDRDRDRFVRPDPAGLDTRSVRCLLLDRDGRVWIGTTDSGVRVLDPRSGEISAWRHDPADPASLGNDQVYAFVEDRSGFMWVGTNGGLDRFDPSAGGFRHFRADGPPGHALSLDAVRSIAEDADGILWVGTHGGGLNRVDPDTGEVRHFRHDPDDPSSLGNDRVRTILEDDAGRLWVGTEGALHLLDRDRGRFTRYVDDATDPTGLSDSTIWSLYQDRGGILWVGTKFAGLNTWNPATWSFGHHAPDPANPRSLSSATITSFAEDGEILYVGTPDGGLNVLDRTTGEVEHHRSDPDRPGSLSDNGVMALLIDGQGTLWIGTYRGGLNRFDPSTRSFVAFRHDPGREDSLSFDGVTSLYEDSQGGLWIGTFGGGLNLFDRATKSFQVFRNDPAQPDSLSSDRVMCLAEDPSGALWVGTLGGGLNRLDPTSGSSVAFRHDADDPTSLAHDSVSGLHVDSGGTLWVGTMGGGLDRLVAVDGASATFSHLTQRDGMPSGMVWGIEPDADGGMWLSTNGGLARLDPANGEIRTYSTSHGLQGKEFNFGAHYRSPSGELFFGGLNGFNAFHPMQLVRNSHVPPVVLTAFLKLYQPVELDSALSALEAVELGYRDRVVTFEFAALDFAAPQRNRYAYSLSGLDDDWIDLGTIHRVSFTSLDPGRYTLRVRAANNDSVWNEDGFSIPIRVHAPPWRTWWAYTLYGLVVAALVLAYVRAQNRKLEREEEYSRRLKVEVEERTQELEQRNVQLAEASLTDALTGLRNRRFLLEDIDRELAIIRRRIHERGAPPAPDAFELMMMMIDLDGFKPINDTRGHAAGDRVLVQVGDLLRDTARLSDVIIRWGGDEFLIVAREMNAIGSAVFAERVRAAVAGFPFELGDEETTRLTCSVGFACWPFVREHPDLLTWEQVVSVADRAMYAAKYTRRNAWLGLSGTADLAHSENLVQAIQEEPQRLLADGHLQAVTSIPDDSELDWR